MATATTVSDLRNHLGQTVTLAGWLYNSRSTGKLVFLLVRDGSGTCQCVLEKSDANADMFQAAKQLTQESSLEVDGTVAADERAEGGYELTVTALRPLHAGEGYPITPKAHGVDFLMKNRHLWLRSRRQWAVMRIRSTVVDAIRRYYNDRGYVLIDTPIFSPAAGEETQTLFKVNYYDEEVYLAQTGQLYVEAACMAHRKVYCFGPTFRAEKSKTRRHLTEFWMVEPEIAFADLDDVIDLAEDFVCEIVATVLRDRRPELEMLERDLTQLESVQRPFYRITYTEAADLLHGDRVRAMLDEQLASAESRVAELRRSIDEQEKGRTAPGTKKWKVEKLARQIAADREELAEREEDVHNIPNHMKLAAAFRWGSDLGGSDETIIARMHDKPVFVTHYPAACKAFYMKQNPANPRLVNNLDLFAPEGYGEIIGGSQREDDYDILLQKIKDEDLDPQDYEWYLDLRRYGSVPHGGFGLGVERTVAWICGLKHVRETIPFARMMGKVYP